MEVKQRPTRSTNPVVVVLSILAVLAGVSILTKDVISHWAKVFPPTPQPAAERDGRK